MKPSEITELDVVEYAHIEETEGDISPGVLLAAAKAYVMSQTGLTEEQLDKHEDITIAILVLCSDMYDNRQTTVDNDKANRVVDAILGFHAVNLL